MHDPPGIKFLTSKLTFINNAFMKIHLVQWIKTPQIFLLSYHIEYVKRESIVIQQKNNWNKYKLVKAT